MNNYHLVLFFTMMLFVATACTRKVVIVKTVPAKSLPPGQAKKLTGSQSAKAFAPGQQKKKN